MTAAARTSARPIVLIGAGGHARVVIDAVRSRGEREVVAVLDADPATRGSFVAGVEIVGDDSSLSAFPPTEYDLVVAVIGFGTNVKRHAHVRALRTQGYELATVVHANAVISPAATVAAGAQVLVGAIINSGARIMQDAIINSGAVVEHDCVVGRGAHLAPRALLGGGAQIGDEAQLGLGAIVLPQVRVGERAIVGAGAVVLNDVQADDIVVGSPARTITPRRT